MEQEKTKLIEEGNTIYEIDLECMERNLIKEQDTEEEPGE